MICVQWPRQDFQDGGYNFMVKGQKVQMTPQCTDVFDMQLGQKVKITLQCIGSM